MSLRNRGGKKKDGGDSGEVGSCAGAGDAAYSLAAFFERLRDLCQDHGDCDGQDRADRIRAQTEQAVTLAAELGILKQSVVTWDDFLESCPEARVGTEHWVEFDAQAGLVGKTTIPHRLRVDSGTHRATLGATPAGIGSATIP